MVTARRSKQLLSLKHPHSRASSSTVLPRLLCVGEDCTGTLLLGVNDLVPGFLGLLCSPPGLQRLDKAELCHFPSLPRKDILLQTLLCFPLCGLDTKVHVVNSQGGCNGGLLAGPSVSL